MAEPAPTNVSVTFHPTYHTCDWTNNDTYDEIHVWRSLGSEASSYYATVSGSNTGYDDYSVATSNTIYKYKFKAYRAPYLPSPFSDEVTVSRYKDILSETVTLSETITDPATFIEAVSDTITPTVTYTDRVTFVDSIGDTVTIGDSIGTSGTVTIATDTQYLLGDSTGAIYIFDSAYTADNGATITSEWTSKTWDGAESDPTLTGKWKTIYRIEFLYVDKTADTPLTFSISSDGGSTWQSQSKTVGVGDGRVEHTHFHFIKSGQFFKFKVQWPSTTKNFQFLGFDIVYEVMADQFETSL